MGFYGYEFNWPFNNSLPKSMPKKEAEQLVRILKEIKSSAEMETADFTEELKEATRRYRQNWLVNPLEAIIKRYEL